MDHGPPCRVAHYRTTDSKFEGELNPHGNLHTDIPVNSTSDSTLLIPLNNTGVKAANFHLFIFGCTGSSLLRAGFL